MGKSKLLIMGLALLAATMGQAQAGIIFSFAESGGSVLMQSSGVLDTANLISVASSSWGGIGIEDNGAPDPDIMGDTSNGSVDTAFGFSAGTDTSAWVGSMFTSDNFGWTSFGTTSFTTYYRVAGVRTPGIGVVASDIVAGLWTPDISWTKAGTFASLGLTAGTYAISDAATGESITIQIGRTVPEPASLALIGLALAGIGYKRRATA